MPGPTSRRTASAGLGLVTATLVVVVAAPAGAPDVASASCVSGFVRDGRPYVGSGLGPRQAARLPPAVGTEEVVQPACNDAGQDDPDITRRLSVLRGVPPSVALADLTGSQPTSAMLYTPGGPSSEPERGPALRSFSVVAGHPLHRALHGTPDEPDRTAGRRCRAAVRTGRIAHAGDDALTLRGRPGLVLLDAATRVFTRRVDGVPRVRIGQRIRVVVLRCSGRRRVVARTIRPVGGG